MKWLMLCREPRLYSCERIRQVCTEKGIELDILDPNRMLLALNCGRFEVFYQEGESYDKSRQMLRLLPQYQAVLPRFGTASTEMGLNVLRHFELRGIPVLNRSSAFRLARDKWQSLQALAACGVAIPNSRLGGEAVFSSSLFQQVQVPLVAKTLSGSQGVGVMLLETQSSAESVLETFRQSDISTLTQQFIAESQGQDIRVIVLGNKVIAAMQRVSSAADFRANIHLGGKALPIVLTDEEEQLAIAATKAIGLDFAGVDLIRSDTGTMVLEVNASPGLEGIEKVSGANIALQLVEYLRYLGNTSGHFL